MEKNKRIQANRRDIIKGIILINCVYKRPFDDQTNERIFIKVMKNVKDN